jgi:hypothetical protein
MSRTVSVAATKETAQLAMQAKLNDKLVKCLTRMAGEGTLPVNRELQELYTAHKQLAGQQQQQQHNQQ